MTFLLQLKRLKPESIWRRKRCGRRATFGYREMGIGNSNGGDGATRRAGGFDPEVLAGAGTGINEEIRRRKVALSVAPWRGTSLAQPIL
jgi:hypothetical protein